MFKPNALYYVDVYKVGHKKMAAKGMTSLYGTWIPRSLKHAPKGVEKVVSFGQSIVVKWLLDTYKESFFDLDKSEAMAFSKDVSIMLGLEYDGNHFGELYDLGYLPIRIKALPEGIETLPNIPHMTFESTVDGFGWLTLFLETIISSIAWKPTTSATIALRYRRNLEYWLKKTDKGSLDLATYLCHDFSSRGLSPWDMMTSGLGSATSFRGSDSMITIPASRYYYNTPKDVSIINSVNASEHSVSTTKIFTVGEKQMLKDWIRDFQDGILSVVADTFNLWVLITVYLVELKDEIEKRNGKLVIRPDSGDPVDILCGRRVPKKKGDSYEYDKSKPEYKGVVQLLWDIFGGTVNEQGYKVLNPKIGTIYGDAITLERQVEIYKRLAENGFAASNVVLGIGSFSYQMNTRDTLGFAAKGAQFVADGKEYGIYKDPITDDGTKKSLKGYQAVFKDDNGEYYVESEVSKEVEETGELQVIMENGKLYNETTFEEVRKRLHG